jgi:hypothetical protein
MYLSDIYSVMVFDGQGPAVANVAMPVETSAPWDRVARPSYAWSQLADIEIEQNNIPEAIAMIEFAYWAADAAETALPGIF